MAYGGSLRLRLLFAATVAVALALAASGVILARIFQQHVEHRVAAELGHHLTQILAGLEIDAAGEFQATATPTDPRMGEPYGGLYWQADIAGGRRLRSRSLWDFELTLSADHLVDGTIHRHDVKGPSKSTLFAIERAVTMGGRDKPTQLRLTVAVDRSEIDEATADYRAILIRSLVAIGAALVIAFGAMLHVGLSPLKRLAIAVKRVHAGERPAIEGRYPTEIEPLVADVNRLLEKERQTIERARERASDLAHGFKTPLAVLGAVSRDLKRSDRDGPAAEIDAQVAMMKQHVDRELARARMIGAPAVAAGGVAVRAVSERIVAAMRRIGRERVLTWQVEGASEIRFAGDETDLVELVGNLCENAAKWATSTVRVEVALRGRMVVLVVEDDGPGIPEGAEREALARGRRLDLTEEGSGLGLDIVRRTADAYGGEITLARSGLGGLRAEITLPAIVRNLTVR